MKKRIAAAFIGLLAVFVGRGLFYHTGFYFPPQSKMPSYEGIAVPQEPSVDFSDSISGGHKGIVLIDLAHRNNFHEGERNVLIQRLIARGLTVRFFSAGDDLKKELLGKEDEKTTSLEKKPSGEEKEEPLPVAFIVVSPVSEFSKEEKKTVNEFVDSGGRLLLIADPPRQDKMNSLALDFGLIFEGDYLYNMKENETNYSNIFVAEFKENGVTKELKKIALYTAGSITSDKGGIAFVDENTASSRIETRKKLSPVALTHEANVLAIYDLTFMTEPYNGIHDNNQLISNIASWLAGAVRKPEEKK